jgi:predicted RecA/RadA family phage recombinase
MKNYRKFTIIGLIIVLALFLTAVFCIAAEKPIETAVGIGALPVLFGIATGTSRDSLQHIRTLKLAHSAAVAIDEIIVSNGLVLRALSAALISTDNIYQYAGKIELPKEPSLAVGLGAIVYWDAGNGRITTTSTANTQCGFCIEVALTTDTTILIYLFPDLTNIASADIASGAVGWDEMALPVLKTATITVTNAELKALRAAQKTLVAAPGATKSIEFISALLRLNYGSEVLTESTDNLALRYTDGSGVKVSVDVEATGFIDAAANTFTNAIPVKDAIVAATGALNKALVLDNDGDGEYGGNASGDTTMTIHVVYRVHDWA